MSNTELENKELTEEEILALLQKNYELTEEQVMALSEEELVEMISKLNIFENEEQETVEEEAVKPEKGELAAEEDPESGDTDVKKASTKEVTDPKGNLKGEMPKNALPKTKSGLVKELYNSLDSLSKEELEEKFEMIQKLLEMNSEEMNKVLEEEEEVTLESTPEKIDVEDLDIDVKEDVQALIHGEELSEDFKEKAATIFEAAVHTKVIKEVNAKIDQINEEYKELLEQKVEEVRQNYVQKEEELTEKVDSYLNYVVEEWMKENQLAVESGIRNDLIENFMSGLKDLFSEHYISVPEEKTDLIDELFTKVESLEENLNEEIEKNVSLTKELVESRKDLIIKEMSSDLTQMETSKLEELSENVTFDSEEEFVKKLSMIKENYFNGNINSNNDETEEEQTTSVYVDDVETITEEYEEVEVDESMKAYVNLLSRTSKNK